MPYVPPGTKRTNGKMDWNSHPLLWMGIRGIVRYKVRYKFTWKHNRWSGCEYVYANCHLQCVFAMWCILNILSVVFNFIFFAFQIVTGMSLVSCGRDTQNCRCLLPSVCARGSKTSHAGVQRVTCRGLINSRLEKTTLHHAVVSNHNKINCFNIDIEINKYISFGLSSL